MILFHWDAENKLFSYSVLVLIQETSKVSVRETDTNHLMHSKFPLEPWFILMWLGLCITTVGSVWCYWLLALVWEVVKDLLLSSYFDRKVLSKPQTPTGLNRNAEIQET